MADLPLGRPGSLKPALLSCLCRRTLELWCEFYELESINRIAPDKGHHLVVEARQPNTDSRRVFVSANNRAVRPANEKQGEVLASTVAGLLRRRYKPAILS